jgi:hypothetical protein
VAESRRRPGWLTIGAAAIGLLFGGLELGLCGLHVSRAEVRSKSTELETTQVTVFGVVATPEGKTPDASKLENIKAQLDKLLPKHGFKLLDAQSKRVEAGESVTCDLGDGYSVVTSLVELLDENGKVQLRCELFKDDVRQFSALVKTPLNQLFFCQRPLQSGAQLLIGVGAR